MALPRFTETTTKPVAYGLTLVWLAVLGMAFFDKSFAVVAAPFGFGAGIWMGRLTETRENATGNGVILGR